MVNFCDKPRSNQGAAGTKDTCCTNQFTQPSHLCDVLCRNERKTLDAAAQVLPARDDGGAGRELREPAAAAAAARAAASPAVLLLRPGGPQGRQLLLLLRRRARLRRGGKENAMRRGRALTRRTAQYLVGARRKPHQRSGAKIFL